MHHLGDPSPCDYAYGKYMGIDVGDSVSSSLLLSSNGSSHNYGRVNHKYKQSEGSCRPKTGFLSLPLEIRNEIYSHLLVLDQSMGAGDMNKHLNQVLDLQILGVSKKIREEAFYILLYRNTWIHFQMGPMLVADEDKYLMMEFENDLRYTQPSIPLDGFLAERAMSKLSARVEVTQRSEELAPDEERIEVQKELLFAYNEGRYNHLCHLVRRIGSDTVRHLDISVDFPELTLKKPLGAGMRLELVRLLSRTKSARSLTVNGRMYLDNLRAIEEEQRTYSYQSDGLELFNDEYERAIIESASAFSRGLYNEAKAHIIHENDIWAIHEEAILWRDGNSTQGSRYEDLEKDMFVMQLLAAFLASMPAPACSRSFFNMLDSVCATIAFRPGVRNWSLLSYARGFLHRRMPEICPVRPSCIVR
ncbi:hypothetical protein AJ79_06246 [Helicocarpus griseus UAMH5409]|uniref:Uncharacterized protein n=1 Tax=Helicocarpus griseus UAMH5409 TaxID=1447875 RepID=A0A2B7XEK3_9EURO|nr:hypothetical protein AJ79_06246 [Helicocarpus griseus UAMH5409]